MRAFDYVRPLSLKEACRLLLKSGGQAKALAGGTDLLVQIEKDKLHLKTVMSLRDIPEMSYVRLKPNQGLAIGAMTPLGVIESSEEVVEHFRALSDAAGQIASVQVRTRATVGGNLCNAAPSADMAPILIAYGARVVLTYGQKERTIPLENFFVGPGQTVLRNGELMKEIQVAIPQQPSFATYQKARRSAMDIAVVGVGILAVLEPDLCTCRELRLVLGAVGPTPLRAGKAESIAMGHKLDDGLIERVSEMAVEEACPISDVRGTASYRKSLVKALTQKVLRDLQFVTQRGGAR